MWTYWLSLMAYWYLSTVVAMAWHSKNSNDLRRPGRPPQAPAQCPTRRDLRLIVSSVGKAPPPFPPAPPPTCI